MPYDEALDNRIQSVIRNWEPTQSKKMFGGVCHLLDGNMFCGVHKAFLILRLGEPAAKQAMEHPSVHPFDITGRAMKGWVMVEPDGCRDRETLANWLRKARRFVKTLPPK